MLADGSDRNDCSDSAGAAHRGFCGDAFVRRPRPYDRMTEEIATDVYDIAVAERNGARYRVLLFDGKPRR